MRNKGVAFKSKPRINPLIKDRSQETEFMIENSRCPYCGASLIYAHLAQDFDGFVCEKCGGEMLTGSGSGGGWAPGVVRAAERARDLLEKGISPGRTINLTEV